MLKVPDFRLETHFSRWEFVAQHHMTASDAESMSLSDLLEMATPEERAEFERLWLGYTETFGAPDLRMSIAQLYQQRKADEILCFTGASEGIFAANATILDRDSHAIVITPNYQSHETLPHTICEVSGIPLDPNYNWALDLERLAAAIRPNTRLLTINFPHNPTGAILPLDRYLALIELCRHHGIFILHDEIFHGLGPSGAEHLPPITDLYEKGLSLQVLSKSYGLPGLRLGWIACADTDLLSGMERYKHYLSICNSAPSERLAKIAIRNREKILARNCALVDQNLLKWDAFFARYPDLFDWRRPDGSCMAFPRYKGAEGVEKFCQRLIENSGILFLPSSIYRSELQPVPEQHFRLGCGRSGLDAGLTALEEHLHAYVL